MRRSEEVESRVRSRIKVVLRDEEMERSKAKGGKMTGSRKNTRVSSYSTSLVNK